MDFMSVKDASEKFGISERRVQKLCEENRIYGAQMISNVWIIPSEAEKPLDERLVLSYSVDNDTISLNELCKFLSISTATGRNWIKLDKLHPTTYYKGHPFFSWEYCEELKTSIQSGENSSLKSRRNKKYVSGSCLYQDYVSENSKNIQIVKNILNEIEEDHIDVTGDFLKALIAECALQLLKQRFNLKSVRQSYLLHDYLNSQFRAEKYASLIEDILSECDKAAMDSFALNPCFGFEYVYEESEDILGLLYISCQNIANRKATGSYFTPTKVVKELINNMDFYNAFSANSKTLDPCCGTGNFLLQLPYDSVENIFGFDIDRISVIIARINMALKYPNCNIDTLYNQFRIADYLNTDDRGFDNIIGNPPWGFDYSDEQKESLRKIFTSANGKNVESYDLFIEHSLKKLSNGGVLSFVLPEAILNVKIHQPIRKIIAQSNSIQQLCYLGNAFDKVQCPCIIMQIKRTGVSLRTPGMKVSTKNETFIIETDREISSDYFSFTLQDNEYLVLQKIMNKKDCVRLKENAIFALGLVTGNNKKYITNTPQEGYETILKGSDICKYRKLPTDNFLLFKPEEFQQVAPVEYYRASEKLLYRFICNQLVFAYDNEQTLSLNSCNILIPKIDGISIKYIMAILNSRIAQFVFHKYFQSVKVLRSHIEEIPIPQLPTNEQQHIIDLVNKIMTSDNSTLTEQLYDQIDIEIAKLFALSKSDYDIIRASQFGENVFL